MTTIAFRDGVLAADSLVTNGNGWCGEVDKIGRAPKGGLWGISGSLCYLDGYLKWLANEEGEPLAAKETSLILVRSDGAVREWCEVGWVDVRAPFYAFGSGEQYAMGAMASGASAEASVRIAARYDTKSGGEITVLKL